MAGHIEPKNKPLPHQGFCTVCNRSVIVTNVRCWNGWAVPLETGECANCHSTIAPYPAMPSDGGHAA